MEKRIPQTLTNSKDIIQTDREYARRSSRARSTRCQENEAWALYKKNQFRESWGDLSGHRYIICPKPPYPAEKILNRRQLFTCLNVKPNLYAWSTILCEVGLRALFLFFPRHVQSVSWGAGVGGGGSFVQWRLDFFCVFPYNNYNNIHRFIKVNQPFHYVSKH